ncbi:MAG: S8 family serine peptidase, partial [Chloroflexota bacterium]
DPDELALVLAVGTRDLLQWALYAAFVSAFIGWILGIIMVGFWSRTSRIQSQRILPIGTILSLVLAVVLYFVVGQPGFHGDQLFIILKDRAEVASAAEIEDLDARRAYVYRTLVEHAQSSQQELTSILDRFGIGYRPYYLVNGLSVDAGPMVQLWLANRPDVDRILQNPVLRPLRAPTPGAYGSAGAPNGPPWNLHLIGADRVWQDIGVAGADVVVGQSDSGVDGQHPELAASYRGRSSGDDYNWYDPWNASEHPVDAGGHGTHTLATVVGATVGVAPGAEWIGCVNLARNLANPALYLDCLQFMLAPFPRDGNPFRDGDPSLAADVLNNSWGCPPIEGCDPDALLDAARALRQAGIFVVASTGNAGPFCDTVSDPLALYDEVLSVGAVDKEGLLAFFSSVGPVTADGSMRVKPDILAPGVAVLSAFPKDSYEYLDGTSMAGPHLAGVVALMWSANPLLKGDVEHTEQILLQTANSYQAVPPACGDQAQPPYNGTGYGIVDAYAAVQAALVWSN